MDQARPGDPPPVRHVGDSALLVEVGSAAEAHRVRAALESARQGGELPGLLETVAGACTVLALVDPLGCDPRAVEQVLLRSAAGETEPYRPRTVRIPVHYDGEDLADVAELTGLTVDEVVRRHAAATYTVAFLGFSPGLGYISGLDPALNVPRRATPRERVPAGSVAIAGEYTTIYPQATPGGWRLLGHTDLDIFDPTRTPPGVFAPGDQVRFVPADKP